GMYSRVTGPPLPCPSRTRLVSASGTGQLSVSSATGSRGEILEGGRSPPSSFLDDIVLSERHVHEVPDDVVERHVRLLDAVNAEGRHHEAVVGELGKPSAVLAREGDREEPVLARRLEGLHEIRRVAARADREGDVARSRED